MEPTCNLVRSPCVSGAVRPFPNVSVANGFHNGLFASQNERTRICSLPDSWLLYVPDDLQAYCNRPLLLLKALYGYAYSGKFLYEEQAEFFTAFGLRQTMVPALWVKHTQEGILLVLHYSDDVLAAGTPKRLHDEFITALRTHFQIEQSERANWYLQSRVRSV
jgi:hypothetical protein